MYLHNVPFLWRAGRRVSQVVETWQVPLPSAPQPARREMFRLRRLVDKVRDRRGMAEVSVAGHPHPIVARAMRRSCYYRAELASRSGNPALCTGASDWMSPQLLLDSVVGTSTVLAHRSVFNEVGMFDTALRIAEDWDLWLRASRVTPILRVSVPYALYRIHPASINRSTLEANFRSLVVDRALGRWGYTSPDGSVANRGDVNRALAKGWSEFGGAHLTAANFSQAFKAGLAAVLADRTLFSGWKVLAKFLLRYLGRGVMPRSPT